MAITQEPFIKNAQIGMRPRFNNIKVEYQVSKRSVRNSGLYFERTDRRTGATTIYVQLHLKWQISRNRFLAQYVIL